MLKRGQERFNIYCTPCHSRVGNGLGAIVERGYKPAANLHDQVRLAQPLSHYFYVMTHGYGAMPDYSAQLTPEDRWAVAAYIRALQLSQAATAKDVPAGAQSREPEGHCEAKDLPASFAEPWDLPATSDAGLSARAEEGTPAMAPANPADPTIKIAASKPAACRPAKHWQPGRRNKEPGRTEWHTSFTRQNASRRLERAGLCRTPGRARAL